MLSLNGYLKNISKRIYFLLGLKNLIIVSNEQRRMKVMQCVSENEAEYVPSTPASPKTIVNFFNFKAYELFLPITALQLIDCYCFGSFRIILCSLFFVEGVRS